MGLFDTIHVDEYVIKLCDIKCPKCLEFAKEEFQTKDLDPCMDNYILRYESDPSQGILSNGIRLYKMDAPDEKYWIKYTNEELAEREEKYKDHSFKSFLTLHDGYFPKEAYLPENRRQRDMGELPHQWVEMYHNCACGQWIDVRVKFTDGYLKDIEIKGTEFEEDNMVEDA